MVKHLTVNQRDTRPTRVLGAIRYPNKSRVARIKGKREHDKALAVYLKNPSYCQHCKSVIMPKVGERAGAARGRKFCSSSCAAIINNAKYPRRFPEGNCAQCGMPTITSLKWCSEKCRNAARAEHRKKFPPDPSRHVIRWRRNLKERAVMLLGGKCCICGYSRCVNSLDFHHVYPAAKEFQISGSIRSWERVLKELAKCVLLCKNCHGEVHGGMIDIAILRGALVRREVS